MTGSLWLMALLLAAEGPQRVEVKEEARPDDRVLEGTPERIDLRERVIPRSASRMALPLKEVPATVNVVSREVLEERGTNDLVSALNNVAGVNPMLTYGGFDFLTIRGFQDFLVLQDGIRDERHTVATSAPMSSLVGVERIEVLKGPASVLYGMGALGGTVNVVRKRPSADPRYEFGAGAGTYEARRASLGMGGPVAPALGRAVLYRLDAGYASGSDFRSAAVDRSAATLALDWLPGQDHKLSLRASYYLNHYDTDAGLPTFADDHASPTRRVPRELPLSTRYNTPYDRMRFQSIEGQLEYWLRLGGAWTLTERASVLATETEYLSAETLDASADRPGGLDREYLFFHHQVQPIANQLELAGGFRALFEHTVLAGYDFSYFHWETPGASLAATSVDLQAPHETQGEPVVRPDRSRVRRQTMHGFYLQDQVALAAKLKLLVGGRLDIWERETRADTIAPETGAVTRGTTQERHTVAPSYRAGLVYLPLPWLTGYASYATSFKPVAVMPADGRQLDPERGRQLELGVRFDPWEGRLGVNLAAYQIDKQDVVIARPMMLYDQAGAVRSRGAEADAEASFGPVRVTAGYAFTHARFVRYESGTRDLAGRRPAFVPTHSASVWAWYRSRRGFGAGIGGRYLGKSFADPGNDVPMTPYLILDLALSYQLAPATLALNVYNLLGQNPLNRDGRYYVSAINGSQLTPGPPRTALVQLRLGF